MVFDVLRRLKNELDDDDDDENEKMGARASPLVITWTKSKP
jgi:hypothetical protein